jgi:hypothetical protein
MSSWKGEGWCEWELLKAARPRFKGHYQPYRPSWGCFDESDPKWSTREISLAADNGIDVFLVDWYWYSGVKLMEEALENGLLKAPNRDRVKFALMWANHNWADYFPAPFNQEWNSWLPSRHTPKDWDRVMEYCIGHYFAQPNYWRTEDKLFFSMFEPKKLVQEMGGATAFKKAIAATNRRLARAKLPPLHLNAMLWAPGKVDEMKEAGFASTTSYNFTDSGKTSANATQDYADVIEAHKLAWDGMANASLPYCPTVTMGWDVTPRCETAPTWPFPPSAGDFGQYPYGHIVVGNTPQRFGKLCSLASEHCRQHAPRPNAVVINAWNEWTEGSFLLPEKRHGDAYLKAIKKAFSRPG